MEDKNRMFLHFQAIFTRMSLYSLSAKILTRVAKKSSLGLNGLSWEIKREISQSVLGSSGASQQKLQTNVWRVAWLTTSTALVRGLEEVPRVICL